VHLVTLNVDGSPQLSCVWVGVDGDEIVSGHMLRRQKVRNVERADEEVPRRPAGRARGDRGRRSREH